MRSTKIKNFCSFSLWTCLHHMVILRSQNKITDFFDDFRPGLVPLSRMLNQELHKLCYVLPKLQSKVIFWAMGYSIK